MTFWLEDLGVIPGHSALHSYYNLILSDFFRSL